MCKLCHGHCSRRCRSIYATPVQHCSGGTPGVHMCGGRCDKPHRHPAGLGPLDDCPRRQHCCSRCCVGKSCRGSCCVCPPKRRGCSSAYCSCTCTDCHSDRCCRQPTMFCDSCCRTTPVCGPKVRRYWSGATEVRARCGKCYTTNGKLLHRNHCNTILHYTI